MATVQIHPVQSSRLTAIGYDEENFLLYIKFPPTKKAPMGKMFEYSDFSPEQFSDFEAAESKGKWFATNLLKNDDHPCRCVDDGTGESAADPEEVDEQEPGKPNAPVYEPSVAAPEYLPEIPEDKDELKQRALTVRTEATALAITTPQACSEASRLVLHIRAERKRATAKPAEIKDSIYRAWKQACDFFNEIDGYYASAEKYLDDGILSFRKMERQRAEAESARLRREEEARVAEARRVQQEEFAKRQRDAQEEADRRSAELAAQDAAAARAQGATEEIVEAILANPLQVAPEPVEMPAAPLSYAPVIVRTELPKVQGLGFVTEWCWEKTDERAIPFTHEFYSLDEKKISARVQALKQHANIPGIRVWPEERSRKRTGSRG